jgi:hypothetical protein
MIQANDIESNVVDPASIAVSRRRRRAKTDAIDGETLLRTLLAWKRGEPRVCEMVVPPTRSKRTAGVSHVNAQICCENEFSTSIASKACSPGQGITGYDPLHKDRRTRLDELTTGDGRPVPGRLKADALGLATDSCIHPARMEVHSANILDHCCFAWNKLLEHQSRKDSSSEMIRRPYSNLSVVELEKLFQRSRTDEEVLAALLAELSQRPTNRAARLRASVLEAGEAAQKSRAPEVPTRAEGTESADLKERSMAAALPPLGGVMGSRPFS